MIDDIITRERGIEAEAQMNLDKRLSVGEEWQSFFAWCNSNGKKPSLGATVNEYIGKGATI